jgi:hypothetical protein
MHVLLKILTQLIDVRPMEFHLIQNSLNNEIGNNPLNQSLRKYEKQANLHFCLFI